MSCERKTIENSDNSTFKQKNPACFEITEHLNLTTANPALQSAKARRAGSVPQWVVELRLPRLVGVETKSVFPKPIRQSP